MGSTAAWSTNVATILPAGTAVPTVAEIGLTVSHSGVSATVTFAEVESGMVDSPVSVTET